MTEQPRRRALINGLYVQFESRDPRLASVRWHSRFKLRYRTKAHALAAKAAWEHKGRIKFPSDFEKPKVKADKSRARVRVRVTNVQHEMRL